MGVMVRNEQSNTQAAQMYGTFVNKSKSFVIEFLVLPTYKLRSDKSKWTRIKHRQSTCPLALKKGRNEGRHWCRRDGSLEEEEISI
jgi:hypothetical protein